jgi:hypothetical protein
MSDAKTALVSSAAVKASAASKSTSVSSQHDLERLQPLSIVDLPHTLPPKVRDVSFTSKSTTVDVATAQKARCWRANLLPGVTRPIQELLLVPDTFTELVIHMTDEIDFQHIIKLVSVSIY